MKTILPIAFLFCSLYSGAQIARFEVEVASQSATEKVYNLIVDDYHNGVAWQYGFDFDGSRMTFREVRNAILDDLDTGDFNEVFPGQLLTVWIDTDLEGLIFEEPTVLYQLVFDVHVPGGSDLCFSSDILQYELVVEDGSGQYELDFLEIHDECTSGLVLDLNSTATEEPVVLKPNLIKDLHLTTEGSLGFHAILPGLMELSIYDIQGHLIRTFSNRLYTEGRHTLELQRALVPGVFVLKAIHENGSERSYKVLAK